MEETKQLAAPAGLQAGNSLGKVQLSWIRPTVGRVKTYEVYRGLEPGDPIRREFVLGAVTSITRAEDPKS